MYKGKKSGISTGQNKEVPWENASLLHYLVSNKCAAQMKA